MNHIKKENTSVFLDIKPPGTVKKWRAKQPDDPDDPVLHEDFQDCPLPPDGFVVAGSIRGRKNAHFGRYREDAFGLKTVGSFLVSAVADGAGSCRLSRVGANLASMFVIKKIARGIEAHSSVLSNHQEAVLKNIFVEAFWQTVLELNQEAKNRGIAAKDLSTTLLAAATIQVGASRIFASLQVGDGLLAVMDTKSRIRVLGSPDLGRYAGESFFLPEIKDKRQLENRASVTTMNPAGLAVLMSDGVAGDFYPPATDLKQLLDALENQVIPARDKKKALSSFMRYEMPGSFDDRTLVLMVFGEAH